MKLQPLLIALTCANFLLLAYSLARTEGANADDAAPVLRGRALEIVDDRGRVRASIKILPADPAVKMPDGTTGYPETVLLRLINSKGGPTVKIAATERGAGMSLASESKPAYVQILADGPTPSVKVINEDGQEQLIKP